jgi:hypothetical protein
MSLTTLAVTGPRSVGSRFSMRTSTRHLVSVGLMAASLACHDASLESESPAAVERRPARIAFLQPRSFGLMVGVTMRVVAVAYDAAGATIANAAVTYASSDPRVVSVDSAGAVTARQMGQAAVIATLVSRRRQLADTLAVTTTCTLELGIRVTPPAIVIPVGGQSAPRVQLWTCGGHVQLTDELRWRSTDTLIARVDSASGLTTGVREGRATVLVSGRKYAHVGAIRVTVTPR